MSNRPGKAFITGATGGIGSEFCRSLAAARRPLMITGRRERPIEELRRELEKNYGVQVETFLADLASPGDVEVLSGRILETEDLEILINNAGLVAPGLFAASDVSRQLEMIDVHVTAPVHFCRAALPAMIKKKHGFIVNVSSLGGFRPAPDDVVYAATKNFLIHFSLALQGELKGTGVAVQVLCPGYTRTGIHRNTYSTFVPPILWGSPEEVVDVSLRRLEEPGVVIPGAWNRVLRRLLDFPFLLRALLGVLSRTGNR